MSEHQTLAGYCHCCGGPAYFDREHKCDGVTFTPRREEK